MNYSFRTIRQYLEPKSCAIEHRICAQNKKNSQATIDEEIEYRSKIISSQIKSWRSMLPGLIKRFSKIPDYRNPNRITHKKTVIMLFGLFAFIFRFASKREINRELTGPVIMGHLWEIFPEIDSIPHADTLSRFLEKTDMNEIEKIHVSLIRDLISKKKFKKLLLKGCVPISFDGTQKAFRQNLWHDDHMCERKVGSEENESKQQYVYVLEANITLRNGLCIPLMTEYLVRERNSGENGEKKQDCEVTAFERMSARLKKHFPRLKIVALMDAMFATQNIMESLNNYRWEYIIRLPKKQLTGLAKILGEQRDGKLSIPGQSHYRDREQYFYWANDVSHGYELELNISLVACLEKYYLVNEKDGSIEECFSEHSWISSIPISIDVAHEVLNLCARKHYLIEDSFNTSKNRGYNYKHIYSYDWNAMMGFHLLMRMAQAINSICEFCKGLKKYFRTIGVSPLLKLIKETLFAPWMPLSWYEEQILKPPQLRLEL